MNARTKIILGTVLLVSVGAFAQEEQSATSSNSASVRYWTLPRIQQEPPAGLIGGTNAGRHRSADASPLEIANETLSVKWASNRLTIVFKPTDRAFVTDASFNTADSLGKVISVSDKSFGAGTAIEISHADGDRDLAMLFPKLPFALLRSSARNNGRATTTIRTVRPFSGVVRIAGTAAPLKTFGTAGLLAPGANPGSYAWLAVVEPQSRNGVVLGWLTHDRGDGVLFSKFEDGAVRVGAQIDYGRLRLAPGRTEELETLAVGYFDDARLGLEAWADAVAKVYDIQLRPKPVGYCTWYSQPHGGASDEKHLAEQSAFAATNLAPFGFSVIQIDDKWQEGVSTNGPKRNFTTHRPSGPYPGGMKAAADRVKSLGLVPGIWFLPFAGTPYDSYFTNHLDWFVKRKDGMPYQATWGGASLDMTRTGARAHLSNVVHCLAHEWGYEYFKIDGLWTGTATRLLYVHTGYREDDLGEAVFDNPDKTPIETYRDGLRLVRAAAGSRVFILGCNSPQNMRSYGATFGLVDGMRVGPDNKAEWKSLLRGPAFGSRHYFLNGRIWHNDPDPVYVRASMPLHHARLICSWVAISGQLNLSSEWLPELPADRLDVLKRTMPYHHATARPVDLFEQDLPRLWLLTDTGHAPRRDVVALFNWADSEQSLDYPLEHIGLESDVEYLAFDYWRDTVLPAMKGRLQLTVPAQSCRILALRARADHPQLLSTSRHVTQGMVDVIEEKWEAPANELSGRSQVVGGDPYELRIVASARAGDLELSAADRAAGVKGAIVSEAGGLVRVKLESPASRAVSWSVRFK